MWHCPSAGWQQTGGPAQSAFCSGEETMAAHSRCKEVALPTHGIVVIGHTQKHRNTEYSVLEGTHIRSNSWSHTGHPQSHTVCPGSSAQTLLQLCPASCCGCFPGEPVPVSISGRRTFSNIPPKPPRHNFRPLPRILSLSTTEISVWSHGGHCLGESHTATSGSAYSDRSADLVNLY